VAEGQWTTSGQLAEKIKVCKTQKCSYNHAWFKWTTCVHA